MLAGRTGLVLLLSPVWLLSVAGPASAHTEVVSSSPVEQEMLQQPPASINLTFSQPISSQFATVTVTGPDQKPWQVGATEVSGASVVQPLRDLREPGTYRADWRVVADDGHPLSGSLSFVYAASADANPAAAAPVESAAPVVVVGGQPPAGAVPGGVPGPDPVTVAEILGASAVLVLGGAALAWRRARPHGAHA